MDPPPSSPPQSLPSILCNSTTLQVNQPYQIHPANSNTIIDYGDTIQQIEAILQDHHQICEFSWKWSNNLKSPEFNKLIQILPPQLTKLSFSGAFYLSLENLSAIAKKFLNLQFLNLYWESSEPLGSYGWDMDYQINIRNSMRNFKQSQKWCHLLLHNATAMSKQILPHLNPQITSLSLRNVPLGRDPASVKTIVECFPYLEYVDLGLTQISDKNFEGIAKQAIQKFANRIVGLKLDCNRISDLAIEKIFPQLILAESEDTHSQFYAHLKVLDISRTNIVQWVGLLGKLPALTCLTCLEITEEQAVVACKKSQHSKLEQIAIEYAALNGPSVLFLARMSSNLHSLTLSYIEVPLLANLSTFLQIQLGSNLRRLNLNYNAYLNGGCLSKLLRNAPNLEILKISGTKATGPDLLGVAEQCKKIKWLQISYLTQLQSGNVNYGCKQQEPTKGEEHTTRLSALELFLHLVDELAGLEYMQAYEFLSQQEADEFKRREIPAKVVFVVDSAGPFSSKTIGNEANQQ